MKVYAYKVVDKNNNIIAYIFGTTKDNAIATNDIPKGCKVLRMQKEYVLCDRVGNVIVCGNRKKVVNVMSQRYVYGLIFDDKIYETGEWI
jgi:hypothetical protein